MFSEVSRQLLNASFDSKWWQSSDVHWVEIQPMTPFSGSALPTLCDGVEKAQQSLGKLRKRL
jgi:hypothetical protein